MISTDYVRADSSGKITGAGRGGHGFSIRPALRPDRAGTDMAGAFPVSVRFSGRGSEMLHVPNSDAHYSQERFTGFDVLNATPDGWYLVSVFELRGDAVIHSGQKTRISRKLKTSFAVPNLSPGFTPATEYATYGIALHPGVRSLQFEFTGTEREVRLMAARPDGTFGSTYALLTDSAAADYVWPGLWFRTVDFPSPGILVYTEAGTGAVMHLDCEDEVG
jgi:hypothetical protein